MTYIFGVGGNATAILSLMLDLNINISGFIVDRIENNSFHNFQVRSTQSVIEDQKKIDCVVSVGDNYSRELVVTRLENELREKVNFPSIIHSTAHISTMAVMGRGVVVFPGGRVGSETSIGNFVHLNTNSSVDHNCKIDDYSSLAPASITGGGVSIGKRTAILMGSAISNGVTVGDDVVLAAMSFLRNDTLDSELWAGSPAVCKKKRQASDLYL